MSPLISVIIPVYNAAGTLQECLSSVLAQSYDNLEIICVDDSSTDNSIKVLEEFAVRDQRIRIIRQEKANAGVARNAGYDVSSGGYVLFLDADDVFAPDMVESLAHGLEEYNADIAVCGWVDFENGKGIPVLGEGTDDWSVVDSPSTSVNVYDRWLGWAWNKMIRRSLIDLNGLKFQSLRSSNDLNFSFSALICAQRVVQTPRRLVAHRKSSQTLSVTRDRDPLCFAEALRKHYAFLCDRGLVPGNAALTGFFRRYVLIFSCWHLDTIRTDENYEKIYRELQLLLVEFSVASAAGDASPSDVFFARYRCMRDHPTPIAYLRAELESSFASACVFAREKDALQVEASGLRAEKDALQTEVSGLRAEKDALQTEASGLRAEKDALQTEASGLRAEKDALQKTNEHLTRTLDTVQKSFMAMKNSYSFRIGRLFTLPVRAIRDSLFSKNHERRNV